MFSFIRMLRSYNDECTEGGNALFGEKLRRIRKNRDITMKELGKRLGVAESTISGYENETRSPDIEMLQKIADYFGVSVDYLLGRVDSPNEIKEDGTRMISAAHLETDSTEDNPVRNEFIKKLIAQTIQEYEESKNRKKE